MSEFDDLLLRPEDAFATCAASYWDSIPQGVETLPRIYVPFRPEGAAPEMSFLALFDPGAHYCILNQRVVELIKDRLVEEIGNARLRTSLGVVSGTLYRHRVELLAEVGEDLEVEATLFVSPEWNAPSFIGYTGFLDRLRWAVNPADNRIYFGSSH